MVDFCGSVYFFFCIFCLWWVPVQLIVWKDSAPQYCSRHRKKRCVVFLAVVCDAQISVQISPFILGFALLTTMTWLYHVLGPHVMVHAVSASRHPRFGTCYHLISRTVMLVVNSSSRALRLGSLCKPTHKMRLWELCLSGNLQILDLIDWSIDLCCCHVGIPGSPVEQTRKPSCRWQTRATPAKSMHGLRKSSVSCIASLLIDSVPMVYYYVLYIVTVSVKCVALEILAF